MSKSDEIRLIPINISEHDDEIRTALLTGMPYRRRVEPERVTVTTKPTYVPAHSVDLMSCEVEGEGIIMPAGTIISSTRGVISEEEFVEDYIAYVDEQGNTPESMYIRVIPASVIENPYGRPIYRTSKYGVILETGDESSYIVQTGMLPPKIYSKEELDRKYVPMGCIPKVKRKE